MAHLAHYREAHPLPFVITHWINLVAMILLIITGFSIHFPFWGGFMGIARGVHVFLGFVLFINCIVRLIMAFFVKSSPAGGTRVQASSTMTGAMLADLGVKNLADENPSLLKDFSLESIIEMNPDYIFVVPMGNDDAAAMKALEDQTAANPAWSTLDAVQNGRYVTLDPHLFQYKPNERWDQSYQVLFDALYA